MAAYPTPGYEYWPGLSTSGIIYNGEDGLPRFKSRFGQTRTLVLPQGAGHPTYIRASSDGLIAFHNPTSNIYYIGNPERPNSYIPLHGTPRQHNLCNSNVVLVTDFLVPVYHLVCAILTGATEYTFDTYSSLNGHWLSSGGINLGCYIIPNTGISCGTFAYWLTVAPQSVIRFNVNSPNDRWQVLLDNVIPGLPETRLQLGRVGNQLGLVSVDNSIINPRVILYLLEEGPMRWQQSSAHLPILNIPRPIRFQSFKVEVFFWVNGRLMIWHNSTVDPRSVRLQWVNTGEINAADGFAHVSTPFLPGNFPVTIQNIDLENHNSP